MKSCKRSRWLWLVPVLILFWIGGAASELRDKLLLEKEGVSKMGRLESAEWRVQKGGRVLCFDVVWQHEGREFRRNFKMPAGVGYDLVDGDGRPLVDEVEIRYAPSRPDVAVVALAPGDPAWVGMIISGVGITALCTVIFLLIRYRRDYK